MRVRQIIIERVGFLLVVFIRQRFLSCPSTEFLLASLTIHIFILIFVLLFYPLVFLSEALFLLLGCLLTIAHFSFLLFGPKFVTFLARV